MSADTAEDVLGEAVVLVSDPGSKLYWAGESGAERLLSADDASWTTQRTMHAQVAAGSPRDARPGAHARGEATNAVRKAMSSALQPAATLPTVKNLAVPHYYWVNSYYCGPASLQTMFGYYRPAEASQYEIATAINAKDWGPWSGVYADDLVRTARFSGHSRAVQNSALAGFKERKLGYGAVANFWSEGGASDPDYATRYSDLKAPVNAGHPVLMLTWYDSRHTVGHFRVLKGYDDAAGTFITHDRWYTAPYYGPNVHFKQSFLVDNLWTQWMRWATVMSPWKVTVSAPTSVPAGGSFTVSATVRYPGVHPMEGRGPVTGSQATLVAPTGFTVDRVTKALPQITRSGQSQTISWTVTPPLSFRGSASFRVTARGTITGSSTSYASYTDYIGAVGSRSVSVVADSSTPNAAPLVSSVSPLATTSLPWEYRTLKARYSDINGADDLRTVMLVANTTISGQRALYVAYSPPTNQLYLRKADNSGWLPAARPGSATLLDNGYARLDARHTTVTRSGNSVIVSWVVSEGAPAVGKLFNVYGQAQDVAGATSGWKKAAAWRVSAPANRAPSAPTLSPVSTSSRADEYRALAATYQDPDGAAQLGRVSLLVNSSTAGARALYVSYDAAANKLYIRSADNTAWAGGVAPGTAKVLDNGYGKLNVGRTTGSRAGEKLTVSWVLSESAAVLVGSRNVYLHAADEAGAASGWSQRDAWLLQPPLNVAPSAVSLDPATTESLPEEYRTLRATYSNGNGAADIGAVTMLVGRDTTGSNALYARYNPATDRLYLRNAQNTGWIGGVVPGSSAVLDNGQAWLDAALTTVVRSDNDLTVFWVVSEGIGAIDQTLSVYLQASDWAGL